MQTVIEEIAAERKRQIDVEGWSETHDDNHDHGDLSRAAISYANPHGGTAEAVPALWPWDKKWWKPTTPRRNLVKAAALIVAEIERLDRQGQSNV